MNIYTSSFVQKNITNELSWDALITKIISFWVMWDYANNVLNFLLVADGHSEEPRVQMFVHSLTKQVLFLIFVHARRICAVHVLLITVVLLNGSLGPSINK